MRGCLYGFFAVILAPALQAAPPATVASMTADQLDQLVIQVSGQRDSKAGRQLAAATLSERVSAETLAIWESKLKGKHARQAIMAVADASAFLDPPVAKIPALPPPDTETQRQILTRTVGYVKNSLHKLPDFSALRTTTSFQMATDSQMTSAIAFNGLVRWANEPHEYESLGKTNSVAASNAQLFWINTIAQPVTYRDGIETLGPAMENVQQRPASANQLTTRGEFGSILGLVLFDVSLDRLVWRHWEQSANGPLAVFAYSVPAEKSHFAVQGHVGERLYNPAYHGEIEVDAATGRIFRITVQTSAHEGNSYYQSSILVEYSPTQIGGVTYICPVRGVALVKYFDAMANLDAQPPPLPYQISVNDVAFTGYHLFRSESRIVAMPPEPQSK
jgi:hypothetical protein